MKRQRYEKRTVSIGNKKLLGIIADSFLKRMIGLMYRSNLPKGTCMLFMFQNQGRYGIWMRNMKFPIDILWLDANKKVVWIEENARPAGALEFNSYLPETEALYVIETTAGFVKRNIIKIGQKASFR
jgi:hypothetical protein